MNDAVATVSPLEATRRIERADAGTARCDAIEQYLASSFPSRTQWIRWMKEAAEYKTDRRAEAIARLREFGRARCLRIDLGILRDIAVSSGVPAFVRETFADGPFNKARLQALARSRVDDETFAWYLSRCTWDDLDGDGGGGSGAVAMVDDFALEGEPGVRKRDALFAARIRTVAATLTTAMTPSTEEERARRWLATFARNGAVSCAIEIAVRFAPVIGAADLVEAVDRLVESSSVAAQSIRRYVDEALATTAPPIGPADWIPRAWPNARPRWTHDALDALFHDATKEILAPMRAHYLSQRAVERLLWIVRQTDDPLTNDELVELVATEWIKNGRSATFERFWNEAVARDTLPESNRVGGWPVSVAADVLSAESARKTQRCMWLASTTWRAGLPADARVSPACIAIADRILREKYAAEFVPLASASVARKTLIDRLRRANDGSVRDLISAWTAAELEPIGHDHPDHFTICTVLSRAELPAEQTTKVVRGMYFWFDSDSDSDSDSVIDSDIGSDIDSVIDRRRRQRSDSVDSSELISDYESDSDSDDD